MTDDPLVRVELQPLWTAARRRLEGNGGVLTSSPLVLREMTPEEADAVAGVLGVRRPVDSVVRVRLDRLDDVLRRSVAACGLVEVLERFGGPLRDRRVERAAVLAAREATWSELAARVASMPEPKMGEWVEEVRRTGLARRLSGLSEGADLHAALDVLVRLPADGLRLATLAADVTGDPHGLDRGRAVGTLVVHGLSFVAGESSPSDAADWRRVWAEAGVACDDLSCDVLVSNLPGWPTEPLRLTLRQVTAWDPPETVPPRVFVCENPAVVAAAVDVLADRGPPIVCLDGIPSTAALVVLDKLIDAGCEVRCHADFDWRGVAIVGVVMRKLPAVRPWRFGAADYEKAVAGGLGARPLDGRAQDATWDPALGPAMQSAGVAVYEEQVLDALLADLDAEEGEG